MTHSRTRRGLLAAAALVTSAVLALTGCATGTPAENAPLKTGGTLTYGRLAAANNLDPHTQITANNAFAIDNIFETLISFDETGALVDWLAERHEVSDDGRTYTFTLRDGVQFSNGTDLVAGDVKFSLERNLALEGPLKINAPITNIAADDAAGTVTITLDEAYTPFLSELSSFATGIVPKDFGGKTEAEFFTKPIGTGAFAIDAWDPAGELSYVKNAHYWQQGLPLIDKLIYSVVEDDTELLEGLSSGDFDVIETVPPADAADVASGKHTELLTDESWAVEQLFFNTEKPEFRDVNVRRAIAHALDLEAIAQDVTFGTSRAATSLLPPTIEYSAVDEGYGLKFDLDAAKAALAKSKYANGFTATLLIPSGNTARADVAQAVKRSLAKINITVAIKEVDVASFRERFKSFDFDFMLNSGQSDAPDPNGLVTFQADPDGFSKSFWTHYSNDAVTELIHKGRATPDGDERQQIYFDIQRMLANDVPYIPLYYSPNLHGVKSGVSGLVILPNGSMRFEEATVAR